MALSKVDVANMITGTVGTANGGFAVGSITGATELASQPAATDEIILSDAGTLKRLDYSLLDASKFVQVATTTTSSSVGTLTFASCFTSTYRNYFATIEALQIGTDNKDVNLLFHYGDSNGNDSTNHNYSSIMRYPSTTDTAQETNGNDIKLVQAQNSGAGNFMNGTIYFFNPLSTTDGITAGIAHTQSSSNAGAGAQMTITSFNMPESGSNSAYTGFQISAQSGNIENGTITVYGIVNPA